ncbi:hypothetical protein HanPI659440_Chr10g0387061 [Helianthus annuus]|nr:hypothetical protein HanPI659440_Chr10g0387061 [Helianthus annuus]
MRTSTETTKKPAIFQEQYVAPKGATKGHAFIRRHAFCTHIYGWYKTDYYRNLHPWIRPVVMVVDESSTHIYGWYKTDYYRNLHPRVRPVVMVWWMRVPP